WSALRRDAGSPTARVAAPTLCTTMATASVVSSTAPIASNAGL
ncbi:MAG: hypothetical protein AVDCRST_MAG14-315, partial [uncultured Rubrobacteraceae bacterium]